MNNKNETISLNKRHIRIIRDSRGGVQRLCLNDLCSFLGREFVRPNQDPSPLCPRSVKMPFKSGGHRMWSVTVDDVKTVTHAVLKEKPESEPRCRQLEQWIDGVCSPENAVAEPSPDLAPVAFSYRDRYSVSFRILNNRVMANATQMTKCFLRQPLEWLRLRETTRLREDMAAQKTAAPFERQIFTTRGRNNGATWVEAPLALELASWLDPEFLVWCRDRCEQMKSEYASLLENAVEDAPSDPPTLEAPANYPLRYPSTKMQRKAPPTDQSTRNTEAFSIPQSFSQALALAAQLQEHIEQNRHKEKFYGELIENRDWFSTTRVAEELRITARQLNSFLEQWNVCRFVDKHWSATPGHRGLQVEVPYLCRNKRGKYQRCGTALRWNQQGREFILRLWKEHNPSPDHE